MITRRFNQVQNNSQVYIRLSTKFQGDVHIAIATENQILTLLLGGWILKKCVSGFGLAKC